MLSAVHQLFFGHYFTCHHLYHCCLVLAYVFYIVKKLSVIFCF